MTRVRIRSSMDHAHNRRSSDLPANGILHYNNFQPRNCGDYSHNLFTMDIIASFSYLIMGQWDWLREINPRDHFAAGRCCQRSVVTVVVTEVRFDEIEYRGRIFKGCALAGACDRVQETCKLIIRWVVLLGNLVEEGEHCQAVRVVHGCSSAAIVFLVEN